ncbi:MAG TPA: NADH-quinone oxidoreductase subunit H, partial [Firmicutes bacterium]|nr:NADH-quinone oxidoreductase subunit H [Bacillota bacterium]
RTAIQFLSYEVPLLLAVLTPAVMAGSWSIRDIVIFQQEHPWAIAVQLVALVVGLLALQAKLERVPFDAPEAETEIVAGPTTEYTGRRLALFRLSTDVQMLVGVALFSSIFLAGVTGPWYLAILLFLVKCIFLVCVLAVLKAMMARLRIQQMRSFCWKYLVPIAIVQMAVIVLIKGGMGA